MDIDINIHDTYFIVKNGWWHVLGILVLLILVFILKQKIVSKK